MGGNVIEKSCLVVLYSESRVDMDSAFGISSLLQSESSAINVFETNGRFDEENQPNFSKTIPRTLCNHAHKS